MLRDNLKTKDSDNYKTPKWILDLFRNYYDPCPLNADPKVDGLKTKWKKYNFVNPPYSSPGKWIDKSISESKKGKLIVLLLKVDTSTKWFSKLNENNAQILWFADRIYFNGFRPNFASMLVILNGLKK